MTTRANFVLGSDGSTSIAGSSKGLSSAQDRARFHALREQADAIVIGGATARSEPYAKTPVPLVVLTRTGDIPDQVRANPLINIWNLDLPYALVKAGEEFGENILLEGGLSLLKAGLEGRLIDELFLTINSATGGEGVYDLSALTRNYIIESSEKIGADQFLKLVKS